MREEREMLLQHELHDQQVVRQDLEGEISTTAARQSAEIQPQIDAIEAAVDEAKGELERQRGLFEKLTRERNEATNRMQELRTAKTDNETKRSQLAAQMVKSRSDPDKMRKQAEVVNSALSALEKESMRMGETLHGLESELVQQVRLPPYRLAFTRYCHHQYCMVYGITIGSRWGGRILRNGRAIV